MRYVRLRAKERVEREIKRREPNPRLVVPVTKQEEGRKGGVFCTCWGFG